MIRLRYPFHHVQAPREVGKNEGLEHGGMVSDRYVVRDQALRCPRAETPCSSTPQLAYVCELTLGHCGYGLEYLG